jgi:hypothetical protein
MRKPAENMPALVVERQLSNLATFQAPFLQEIQPSTYMVEQQNT